MTDYEIGYECGYKDMALICRPKKTFDKVATDNLTCTHGDYLRVLDEIKHAVYNFNPSQWELGYGDGGDDKAVEVGHGPDGKCEDCGRHLRAGTTCRECGFVSEEEMKF